ncbi:MAG: NfeD family protein [Azoarcus sp.]|nr:NfeD family protein [Azoarcus sp.]
MEWWHWIVAGIALVLLELVIPSFFVLWFGLGALIVGLLTLIAPSFPLTGQILLWAIASAVMTVLWFRVFSRFRDKTQIGTAGGDIIGEIGLLVADTAQFGRGKVRFQRPVLGAEEWPCTSDAEIPAGTRVKLISVEGNFFKVTRA